MNIESVEKMNFERGDVVVLKVNGEMSGEDWNRLLRWCEHLKNERGVFALATGIDIDLDKMSLHELRELVTAGRRIIDEKAPMRILEAGDNPIADIENARRTLLETKFNQDSMTFDTPKGQLTAEQVHEVIIDDIRKNGAITKVFKRTFDEVLRFDVARRLAEHTIQARAELLRKP